MSVYHRDDPYAEVIDAPCPRCKAEPGFPCRNPAADKPAHIPCILRTKVGAA